jgi:hypothetical protein
MALEDRVERTDQLSADERADLEAAVSWTDEMQAVWDRLGDDDPTPLRFEEETRE